MKKRIILSKIAMLMAIITVCLAFSLTGCIKRHTHDYTATVTNATCTEQGYTLHTCSCGDSYIDNYTNALGHSYQISWSWTEYTSATATFTCANDNSHVEEVTATITSETTTAATCEETGLIIYTATVMFENETYTDEKTETISAIGHDYQISWSWNGYNSVTATFKCTNDNTHKETVTATGSAITNAVTEEATCITDGVRTYTATVMFDGKTYTDTKTESIAATDHNYGEPEWTWSADGKTASAIITCINDSSHTLSGNATITSAVKTVATCTTQGATTYTAKITLNGTEYTSIKDVVDIPALEHSYGEPTYVWNGTTCTATRICGHDSEHKETEIVTASVTTTQATCTEGGYDTYTAEFTNTAFTTQVKQINESDPIGHEYKFIWNEDNTSATYVCQHDGSHTLGVTMISEITAPTCTADGYTVYTATVYVDDTPITDSKTVMDEGTATDHNYGEPEWTWTGYTSATATFTCANDSTHKETITATGLAITNAVTEEATCTTDGVRTYTATVTFEGETYIDINTESIAASGEHTWVDNVCTVCGYDAGGSKGLVFQNVYGNAYSVYGIGDCTDTDVIIPSTYNGLPVTGIANSAFNGCTSLTSITIPESVTSIGNYAFQNCASLTEINTPESVTSIGSYAFAGCSLLTDVTIPESVMSIGDYAFRNCTALESITIPDGVASIGTYMFHNCSSLKNVTLGTGVTSIGNNAFRNCTALTNINIPTDVTSIGSSAFFGCSKLTDITIPTGVTSIGSSAFHGCSSLSGNIIIPDGVTSIGEYTFQNCSSLESVTLGNGVKSIGSYAFRYCSSLASVTMGNSITNINMYAFDSCSELTTINIPDSVIYIWSYAFQNCSKLTDITIPEGVTCIDQYAFYNCSSLTSITIPDSVTIIGNAVFAECASLAEVIIGNGVTTINQYAFNNCALLTNLTIGNKVETIENTAFYGCSSLTSVVIPDSVTSIGSSAFRYCTSLTSVTIGSNVTSIDQYAFSNCTSLTSVTFKNTEGWWYASTILATSGTEILSTDLSDTTTAATYLTSNYTRYYWSRTVA